jgi:meso-butanediol dehydrogenase / (S,S)-butanediol dehydrogenase / diacetyl reductase
MGDRLAGKVALITGTGSGIGRAAALLFAMEGARVAGCDIDAAHADQTVLMIRKAGDGMGRRSGDVFRAGRHPL